MEETFSLNGRRNRGDASIEIQLPRVQGKRPKKARQLLLCWVCCAQGLLEVLVLCRVLC